MPPLLRCKNYRGKGMERGEKKVSLHRFLDDQKIASQSVLEKMRFGASYSFSLLLLVNNNSNNNSVVKRLPCGSKR